MVFEHIDFAFVIMIFIKKPLMAFNSYILINSAISKCIITISPWRCFQVDRILQHIPNAIKEVSTKKSVLKPLLMKMYVVYIRLFKHQKTHILCEYFTKKSDYLNFLEKYSNCDIFQSSQLICTENQFRKFSCLANICYKQLNLTDFLYALVYFF